MALGTALLWKGLKTVLGFGGGIVKDLYSEKNAHEFRMSQTENESEKNKLAARIQEIDLEIQQQKNMQEHYQKTHGPNWTRIPLFLLECIAVFAAGAVVLRWLYGYAAVGDIAVIKWIVGPVLAAMTGVRVSSMFAKK